MAPEGLGFTINFEADMPLNVEKRGPDEDAVLALVTSLRFFVQPRDGISLEQIASLYDSLPVEERARESARSTVESLRNYLDSSLG